MKNKMACFIHLFFNFTLIYGSHTNLSSMEPVGPTFEHQIYIFKLHPHMSYTASLCQSLGTDSMGRKWISSNLVSFSLRLESELHPPQFSLCPQQVRSSHTTTNQIVLVV